MERFRWQVLLRLPRIPRPIGNDEDETSIQLQDMTADAFVSYRSFLPSIWKGLTDFVLFSLCSCELNKKYFLFSLHDMKHLKQIFLKPGTSKLTLEEDYGFKLILRDRDFAVGMEKTDNIATAVKTSRRMILLLSMSVADFFDSV